MKSFRNLYLSSLIFGISALVGSELHAYPSSRPLPRRVVDSDSEFLVLRDHRESKRFYLIPRSYKVVRESYPNIGNRDVSCEIIGAYQETDRAFSVSLQQRALLVNDELKLQKTELELRGRYELEIAALKQRQIQIERELNRMNPNPDSEEQIKMRAEVELIKTSISTMESSLQRMVDDRAARKVLLDNAESDLTQHEKGLKSLETIIRQPIAKASIQLAAPLVTRSVRRRMGFFDSDEVQMPMIISSKVFPTADPLQSGQDPAGSQATGNYLPEWTGIKPFSPRPTDLANSSLPVDMRLEAIPPQISFEQTLSVFHFCRLQASGELPRMDILFGIAQWEDDFDSRPRFPEMGRLLMIVEPSVWSDLRELPVSTDFFQGTTVDAGEPSAFVNTKGKLIHREFLLQVKR